MEIVNGFRFNRLSQLKSQSLPYIADGFRTYAYLIIRLPGSRVLKLLARSLLLSLLIVSFPRIGSIDLTSPPIPGSGSRSGSGSVPLNLEFLPLFRDLNHEGLLKLGDKALFVSNGGEDAVSRNNTGKNSRRTKANYLILFMLSGFPFQPNFKFNQNKLENSSRDLSFMFSSQFSDTQNR